MSNSIGANFLIRHSWDRYAFPVFVALIWFVILMGFVPQIVQKFAAHEFNYPLAVHVHAAVYVSWLILLAVQTALIGGGRIGLHRRIGRIGAGIAIHCEVAVCVALVEGSIAASVGALGHELAWHGPASSILAV